MKTLQTIALDRAEHAGVVMMLPEQMNAMATSAKTARLAVIEADLSRVANRNDLLAELARAFGFPDWFGHNWDALADCLSDLSWKVAEGYVVCLHGSAQVAAAAEYETALEIFADCAEYWREEGTPFWALVEPSEAARNLPATNYSPA